MSACVPQCSGYSPLVPNTGNIIGSSLGRVDPVAHMLLEIDTRPKATIGQRRKWIFSNNNGLYRHPNHQFPLDRYPYDMTPLQPARSWRHSRSVFYRGA